ncbi:hypothetical protein [Streptomyces gilvosporeus]|uniref:Type A2 lantipeptide n=1 Tax=Streptomyces gilvosporeus TaxID=553510 RepID=A0A1V0TYZ4_9ACTN|nr:hypothetical protein [Streptomyces gilvosporeus]ARF58010.1 hypothetical protein B1H19_30865 [Streptomyces gilvosporeus]
MRFTSEINASEISDSELDGISGGLASGSLEIAGHGGSVNVGDVAGTAQALAASTPASQLAQLVQVHTFGL